MGRQAARPNVRTRAFRPKRALWAAAWIVCLVFTTPIFFTFYLLSVPRGQWLPFAAAHVILLLAFATAAWRLHGAGVWMSADGIREREYFSSMVFTPVEAIANVTIVRVHGSSSDEISRQIFFMDAAGDTVLRLRSALWHASDLAAMIAFYDVSVQAVPTELTWSQLRKEYARNLDRWERHPAVAIVIVGLVFAGIAIGATLGIMRATH